MIRIVMLYEKGLHLWKVSSKVERLKGWKILTRQYPQADQDQNSCQSSIFQLKKFKLYMLKIGCIESGWPELKLFAVVQYSACQTTSLHMV